MTRRSFTAVLLLVVFFGVAASFGQNSETSSLGFITPINLAQGMLAEAFQRAGVAPPSPQDAVDSLGQVLGQFPSPVVELFVPGFSGSGTVVHPAGVILTNFHVVGDLDGFKRTGDAQVLSPIFVGLTERLGEPSVIRYGVEVVATRPEWDLAAVAITELAEEMDDGVRTRALNGPVALPFVALGDSDDLGLGNELTLVGYPVPSPTLTATRGIITGVENEEGQRVRISTDARIASGNSGGAALDASGRLVGVPTALILVARCGFSVTPRVTNNIFVGSEPTGVDVSLDSRFVYAANFSKSGSVSIIDAGTNVEIKRIGVGSFPYDLQVSPDGKLVVVTNRASDSISLISIPDHRLLGTVKVGDRPEGIGFSPDSRFAYVANRDGNSISVVDLRRLEVVTTVGNIPAPTAVVGDLFGQFIYVASNDVLVLDAQTLQVVDAISVGRFPIDLVLNPQGTRLYVSVDPSGKANVGQLVVINTLSNEVLGAVEVGKDPFGVDISPDGRFVYVANFFGTGGVTIVDSASGERLLTVADAVLGGEILFVAASPDGRRVYGTSVSNNVMVIETSAPVCVR